MVRPGWPLSEKSDTNEGLPSIGVVRGMMRVGVRMRVRIRLRVRVTRLMVRVRVRMLG